MLISYYLLDSFDLVINLMNTKIKIASYLVFYLKHMK